jgi:hypothetical protein
MAMGRYKCRVDIGGFFVIQDYVEERDGRVVYQGHGIFGWDDAAQKYTWFWVDSLGHVPSAASRGTWTGDTLVFEHEAVGNERGRYTFSFRDEDSYDFRVENSQDGGQTWRLFLEATYQRQ